MIQTAVVKLSKPIVRGMVVGLALTLVLHTGCQELTTFAEPCAEVAIEGTDEEANNFFTQLRGNQCDILINPEDDGEGSIVNIDLLDRSTGSINPRVLLTLHVSGDELPINNPMILSRTNNIDLAPAVYQEIERAADSGPFWSSSSGTVEFTQDESGVITGTFSFAADNPSSLNNEALGELQVEGTLTIQPEGAASEETCGMGTAPAATGLLLTLGFVAVRRPPATPP